MEGIFHPDSKLMDFLNKMTDLMILNLIFIITSLPLFTIGASLTALYTVMLKRANHEDIYIVRTYFEALRSNLKKSVLLWLLVVLSGLILYAETVILLNADLPIRSFLLVVQGVLILSYITASMLSFPLLSHYGSGMRETLRKALLLPFVAFPEVLALVAVNILPYVLTIYVFGIFPKVMMFWGFIGFSILIYYSSIIMNRIHMKIT